MHKSFSEKIRDFFIGMGKKFRFLLPLAALGLLFTILLTRFVDYCRRGVKRFACVSFVLGAFLIGNSFAFPTFIYEDGFVDINPNNETIAASDSALSLALDVNVSIPQESVPFELEDIEVLEERDSEYGEVSEDDTYSLEDILANVEENSDIDSETVDEDPDISFSSDDWKLMLVNKQHPIPEDYTFELGKLSGNMQCDSRIIDDLLLMMKAASDEGISLVICSPYRDIEKQEKLFNRKINLYMKRGNSYIDAYKTASQIVTVPGASEHQIGLALDLITRNHTNLDEGFADTEAGKWLKENCADYGFILRYPEGKEYITSIEYEPWHFRYVGKEAARIIMDEGICLEEFWEKYM